MIPMSAVGPTMTAHLMALTWALLLFATVLADPQGSPRKRQSYYQKPSPSAYYKKPAQPQQSYYQTPAPQAAAYQPRPQPVYYKQPAYQVAAYQQAAYQQPAYQQPAYQQPAYQQPAYQQPAYQQPAYQQPAYQQPAYYQPQAPQYKPAKKDKKGQDLSKVPGTAGVDYPVYHEVPDTKFHCGSVPATPGIYANVETGCQAYHVCHDGREGHQGASFLCPNGTVFNQHEFACDWWYNVNCADAPTLYSLNADPEKNPYSPKPKKEEELAAGPEDYYHP